MEEAPREANRMASPAATTPYRRLAIKPAPMPEVNQASLTLANSWSGFSGSDHWLASWKYSGVVFMEVTTTSHRGTSHTTARIPTSTVTAQPPGLVSFRRAVTIATSLHLETLEHGADVEDGNDKRNHCQHHRDAGPIAELKADERVPEHGHGERFG